jgi:hypothetical protein
VLNAVSCPSASACTAVGSTADTTGPSQTLIENWTGTTWTVTASPNPQFPQDFLASVSCSSATWCAAAGYYNDASSLAHTLIETSTGKTWSIVTSPNQGTGANFLTGVSCVQPTFCMAVGYSDTPTSIERTLIESWDGRRWTVMPNPTQGTGSNVLNSVTCLSTQLCVAAGFADNGGGLPQTLIEEWNGTAWTIAKSPNVGSGSNILSGVSCVPANLCVAVGHLIPSGGIEQALIETWNGTTWSVASQPGLSGASVLNGVSCLAVISKCVAVGSSTSPSYINQTLIETLTGQSWSITSSPNHGTDGSQLSSVSCASATSCAAVGVYLDSTFDAETMVDSWNGTNWTLASTPNSAFPDNALTGVSCPKATSVCNAVGLSYTPGGDFVGTLVEHQS